MGCDLEKCEKEHQKLNAALIASGIPDMPPNDLHSPISICVCPSCGDTFCGQHVGSQFLEEGYTDIQGEREFLPGIKLSKKRNMTQARCTPCWKNGTQWIVKKD